MKPEKNYELSQSSDEDLGKFESEDEKAVKKTSWNHGRFIDLDKKKSEGKSKILQLIKRRGGLRKRIDKEVNFTTGDLGDSQKFKD